MAKDNKNSLTVIYILAVIRAGSLMGKVSMFGKIRLFIKEILKMALDKGMVDYNKTLTNIMRAALKKILNTDMVFKCIEMVIFSKDNIARGLEVTEYIPM